MLVGLMTWQRVVSSVLVNRLHVGPFSAPRQESAADATVSAPQCRHLAIRLRLSSCDRMSNLGRHLAKALELRK